MYAEVAVCLPFSKTFIYEISRPVETSTRVAIPFGTRAKVQGFVVGTRSEKPADLDTIRPVTEILDSSPLIRPDVFELCCWIADYYLAPLGEVLKGALPPAITEKHVRGFDRGHSKPVEVSPRVELTGGQASALEALNRSGGFQTLLLHGVTGSGKTEIYMRAVEQCRKEGKSALVLVPEISLTPQLRERFGDRFGPQMALLHSSLTRKQRIEEWLRIYNGLAPIVIGTRSALFVPLDKLGIIIVDEEHDASYKQDEMPRYHARDCAVMRAKMAGVPVVLGSATPSMESFRNAELKRYTYVHLPDRVEQRALPEVEIVNMRDEYVRQGKQSVFSERLLTGIKNRIDRGEQSIILLNRRGFSMFLLCRHCGHSFHCRDCSVSMTYHRKIHRLLCHYCGLSRKPDSVCPECSSEYIQYVGEGTEQLEQLVRDQFPDSRVARVDRDTMRHLRDYDRILGDFRSGNLDILVGTQMVAKGHDFPRVTLVGVIAADAALSLPDFRAAERTFQLLTQVAGRSGRGEVPGEVVIQSYFPDHYTFQLAVGQRFEEFYKREVHFRRAMFYPPFTVLAGIMVQETSRERAARLAAEISTYLDSVRTPSVRILGPAPAPVEKLSKTYRHQLLIKSATRKPLHRLLAQLQTYLEEKKVSPTRVIIDVDPISLL
jgi:primosomal protein N' (replication factor Y)